jgi:hypothetical protein
MRRVFFVQLFIAVSIIALIIFAGCSGTPIPSITGEPRDQAVVELQSAMFSVTATGTALSYQWQKNGQPIEGATSQTYTTPRTTAADTGTKYTVVVTNPAGSTLSSAASLTVGKGTDVVTYHYDNARTGQNLQEGILKPQLVAEPTFGKIGTFPVDGKVDSQPLYLSNVKVPTVGPRNILYVVTEHGTVYAFDADSIPGSPTTVWKQSTLLAGETTSDDLNCPQIKPEIGITSTPVIDRTRGAIYVVAMSKDANGNYFQRLHALNIATGQELFGGPTAITATYPGVGDNSSNGVVAFDPKKYKERSGLVEVDGSIFTTWASHCDDPPYTSWAIGLSADTLASKGALNFTANGQAGGIWMSGAAPAVDADKNLYFITGNGTFDTTMDANNFPANGNCGNCFVKMSTTPPYKLLDYFTPSDTISESAADLDFGSGGPVLLPDVVDSTGTVKHLTVGAGKSGSVYVLDRDNMGRFNSNSDNTYQKMSGELSNSVYGKPSYFNSTVYVAQLHESMKAYPIVNGKLADKPSTMTKTPFPLAPGAPIISASGSANAIVWVVEADSPSILHAYDATNLATELYNSNQAPNSRDQFIHGRFITPMEVNGKVYIGTSSTVEVFGLLP